ncbi:TPA: hypothetical protein DDZ86_02835 [Candidatus Dependentiae bacterium]|nr:MAG: hypothetical protein UW09_C0001G0080 [candidate division TM6 bacterium GW2011_GWF2_43_87]HBL98555.1 hypothetical protein [Candidatus Dependentiae bacterium]
MKQQALIRALWVSLLAGLMPWQATYGVVWNGVVATNVTNDPVISITGNVLLGQGAPLVNRITVLAATTDTTVTTTGNWSIAPNDGAGQVNGPVVLDLVTQNGHTIDFDLTSNLEFIAGDHPFLITASGDGHVNFHIAGGSTVLFDANGLNGTYFLVSMDAITHTPAQIVTFARREDSNADAKVYVDAHCMLGFVSTVADFTTQSAIMAFDASNLTTNTGRLILELGDQASVSVQGYLAESPVPYSLSDLFTPTSFATLAGASAEVRVITRGGAGVWSGFEVINNNTVYPALRANPWLLSPNVVGQQPGFVVGINGLVSTDDQTYFDYIGGVINFSPAPIIPLNILQQFEINGVVPPVNTLVKERNASALITDGTFGFADTHEPQFVLRGLSKFYFRTSCGFTGDPAGDFLVPPAQQFTREQGYGSIVLDTEGFLNVLGSGQATSALNVLSLQEDNVGGSVLIEGTETNFKVRTFAKDLDGAYLQYGKACFMVNGRINFAETSLQHTDEIHRVFENNILGQSEPTYIGGETFKLALSTNRPTMALHNAQYLFNTSAAFSGVDTLTPSYIIGAVPQNNNSRFVYYYNGYALDEGTGRNVVLGSNVGGTACDMGTIVDRDAHCDVRQENAQAVSSTIQLALNVAPNNHKIVEALTNTLPSPILGQYSLHTLFLAHGTNISLGINAAQGIDPVTGLPFTPNSTGTMLIDGTFFSFETQGGELNDPKMSVEEGQGGIFVDNFGYLTITNYLRASVAAMVATSHNGVVNLPASQVLFDARVGITNSELVMSNTALNNIIIPSGATASDYTLNWKYVTRASGFVPYELPQTPAMGNQTAAVPANYTGIPIISGVVEQFQFQNSRLGDSAHIYVGGEPNVKGGKIRELVFLRDREAGDAATAVVVLANDAEVGLGSAGRNWDSPFADLVLGINGVTLMPNGSAQVFLNEDVIINNVCHIVPGQDFGALTADQLIVSAETPKKLTVKRDGVLDLSLLTNSNQQLVFGGDVRLVFEPGSRLIMGGGDLIFTDNASMVFERYIEAGRAPGTVLTDTDYMRVKFNGSGNILMKENASVWLPRDAYVGIENGGAAIGGTQALAYTTAITWAFIDYARFNLGDSANYGGSLQIGNTTNVVTPGPAPVAGVVDFTLQLDGIGAWLQLGSQGFLGLGCGIVYKPQAAPNAWLVQPTYNARTISLILGQGTMQHNEIYTGDDLNASLLAIGAASTGFNVSASSLDVNLLGGGNLALVSGATPINPTVTTIDGVVNSNLSTSILASKDVLLDPSKGGLVGPATPANTFTAMKANAYEEQVTKRAQFSQNTLGTNAMGYITGSTIVRYITDRVVEYSGTQGDPEPSLKIGVVGMALGTDGTPTAYVGVTAGGISVA